MATVSFSGQAKSEICSAVRKAADKRAFLTGVLLSARRLSDREIILQTKNEALAALFPQLVQAVSPKLYYDTECRTRTDKRPIWNYLFTEEAADMLLHSLNIDPAQRAAAVTECTAKTFVMLAAGCFVMCGSINNPELRYHLELVLPDAALAEAFRCRLAEEQPTIVMKQTVRKGDCVLYLKQNEQICDALTFFGAPNASLELVEQQVYKSIRSQTNRRTNCDLANIDKTVAAGAQQAADIRKIAAVSGLDSLPETLQEIARLRLDDPEANLRDLGAMCKPPISRSGVHHRLQRLSAIAAKIPDQPKK